MCLIHPSNCQPHDWYESRLKVQLHFGMLIAKHSSYFIFWLLCLLAPSMQYSSSLAGLTPELAELLLNHMSRERMLRPRTLELFFGCPLRKFVLNCYPYSTNELLRQLRAFTALKHLSLVNSPLITGMAMSFQDRFYR